jgi:hypothetical protein
MQEKAMATFLTVIAMVCCQPIETLEFAKLYSKTIFG